MSVSWDEVQNLGGMIFRLHKDKHLDMKNQGVKKGRRPLLRPSGSPYPAHPATPVTVQEAEATGGPKASGASEEGSARAADEVAVHVPSPWTRSRRERQRKL